MFNYFLNRATAATNNTIDFSRSADLIRSGQHSYTTEQMLVRGAMILTTATAGFLGAFLNDESKTNYSSITMSLVCGTIGLVLSHGFVIAPLVKKRMQMQRDCDAFVKEIKTLSAEKSEYRNIEGIIKAILDLSMAKNNKSNASLTLGRHKSLLQRLKDKIKNNDDTLSVMLVNSSPAAVLSYLKNNGTNEENYNVDRSTPRLG